MRKAMVYYNQALAGNLVELDRRNYRFTYDEAYFNNPAMPAISLTLPKNHRVYDSAFLFPFFEGLIAEGVNKKVQGLTLKIDEADDFGFLLATTGYDTIGAITLKPIA